MIIVTGCIKKDLLNKNKSRARSNLKKNINVSKPTNNSDGKITDTDEIKPVLTDNGIEMMSREISTR